MAQHTPSAFLTLWLALVMAPAHGQESTVRGAYLVQILGCGRCHTEGYLTGSEATGPHLAGSRIGIGYTSGERPAIVFPSNLTQDPDTGIGGWTRDDIINAITRGVTADRHRQLAVMPWMNYSALADADVQAIADYLLSLPSVSNRIPDPTPAGAEPTEEYVRFGIYRFKPRTKE
jgi:mono/diheme cytochrome c family protein